MLRRAVLCLVVCGGGAWAEDRHTIEEARRHLRESASLYDDGRYDEAAREIEAAYALHAHPDLQYNLAQCYERLGKPDLAAAAYRRYLAGKPTAEDRPAVEARIANLERRANEAPSPPREKVVLKEVVVYREPPAPGRGARVGGYALGAVAVAALAAGISLAVLAKQNADEVSRSGSLTAFREFSGDLAAAQASGRAQAVGSAVSFAVAAAATGAAAGLFFFGAKIDRESRELVVAPAVLPGGGGLALGGQF